MTAAARDARVDGPAQRLGTLLATRGGGITIQFDITFPSVLAPKLVALLDADRAVVTPAGDGVPSLRWVADVPRTAMGPPKGKRWLRVSGLPPGLPPQLQQELLQQCLPGVTVEEWVRRVYAFHYDKAVLQSGQVLVKVPDTAHLPSSDVAFAVGVGPRHQLVFRLEDIDRYRAQEARGPQARRARMPPATPAATAAAARGGTAAAAAAGVGVAAGAAAGAGAAAAAVAGAGAAAAAAGRAAQGPGDGSGGSSTGTPMWHQRVGGRVVPELAAADAALVRALVQTIFGAVVQQAGAGGAGGVGGPLVRDANPFALLAETSSDVQMGVVEGADRTPVATDLAAAATRAAAAKRGRAAAAAATVADAALLRQAVRTANAERQAAATAAAKGPAVAPAAAAGATGGVAAASGVGGAVGAAADGASWPQGGALPLAALAGAAAAGGGPGFVGPAELPPGWVAGGGGGEGGLAAAAGAAGCTGPGRPGEEEAEPGVCAKLRCQGRRGGDGDDMDISSAAPPGAVQ